jgi:hypothetical protein
MSQRRTQIVCPREVLLVEIERRCAADACRALNRIGLTKEEARAYRGYTCARCERRYEDVLTERDIPDWWEELTLTGLDALRPRALTKVDELADDASASVTRLSAAWRERELTAARAEAREADEA